MASYFDTCKGLAVVDLADRDATTLGKRIRDGESDFTSDYVDLRNTRRRLLLDPSPSVSLLDISASSNQEDNSDSDLEDKGAISDVEGQQEESVQVETRTFYDGGATERSNLVLGEGSGSMSTENSHGEPAIFSTPLELEIDEFLTAAEKNLQKCFSDKYNFDSKKSVPLEGRYEWVTVDHEWP